MGYSRAGFDVVGVDINHQPRFPFEFVNLDAISVLKTLLCRGSRIVTSAGNDYYLSDFAAIHASPPCQHATTLKAMHKGRDYPNLIPETRELLQRSGKPFVMENVSGAAMHFPVTLCGSMFGLGAVCRDGDFHQLRRHRLFECSHLFLSPPCQHKGRPVGVYGNGGGNATRAYRNGVNGFTGTASERREAMGIDWMSRYEISQAIPPAYTEWIGKQLMRAVLATREHVA